MSDNASDPAPRRRSIDQFAHGDRIRITSGMLAGLTGMVVRLSISVHCVLIIDGWPDGVYVIPIDVEIETLEPDESLAS